MINFTCSFDPDTPDDCPPTEARQGCQTIFRRIDKSYADKDDFVSDVKAGRSFADRENCHSWGCSVWVDEVAVENALKIFKSYKKKYIVKGEVSTNDGAILHTPNRAQQNHHTFWKADAVDVSAKFSIFIDRGVRV